MEEEKRKGIVAGLGGDQPELLAQREVIVVTVDDDRIRQRLEPAEHIVARLLQDLELRAATAEVEELVGRDRVNGHHRGAARRGPIEHRLGQLAGEGADLEDRADAGRVEAADDQLAHVGERISPPRRVQEAGWVVFAQRITAGQCTGRPAAILARGRADRPIGWAVAVSVLGQDNERRALMRDLHSRFPRFGTAVLADATITARFRGDRHEFRSRLDALLQAVRLCVVSDAFLAQVLYRAKASMQARGVPVLPRVAHRLAMMSAQVSIGDPVVVHPGVYIVHGQVVIDGLTEIGSGSTIAPWVTIGLRSGNYQGPVLGGRPRRYRRQDHRPGADRRRSPGRGQCGRRR